MSVRVLPKEEDDDEYRTSVKKLFIDALQDHLAWGFLAHANGSRYAHAMKTDVV